MDAAITEYHKFIVGDVLHGLEGLTSRPMFGGYGLYDDGAIFGIITGDGELRFKVDDSNRAQYEAYGSTPFIYSGHKNGKPVTMNYYLVPEEIQDDHNKVCAWARQSATLSRNKKAT